MLGIDYKELKMRTENEIVSKVLEVAGGDENVRAVIRTSFLPVREYLHDYQFYFIVRDLEAYEDSAFESCFGDRILLFRGDRNYPELFPSTKAYLMVFSDGITLVINAITKDSFLSRYQGELQSENVWIGDTFKKILDKDGSLPEIERLVEKQTFFAGTPSEEEFTGANIEFWWVMNAFGSVAELWNKTGRAIAERSGFAYPEKTEERMLAFIRNYIRGV